MLVTGEAHPDDEYQCEGTGRAGRVIGTPPREVVERVGAGLWRGGTDGF